MRSFLLDRVSRLAAYARDAELAAARRQMATKVVASGMGGIATAGVYAALGGLLAVGALPLSVAGTAGWPSGRDGAELSGGQWQRIAAARGFYRVAPLLIMDEPTAALDARAEYALFSSIRTLALDRSVLIILMELGGQCAELYTLRASQYNM
jgi:ABC-type molybdenum transport system ATPase subunit/photorepair protein PhrA